MTVIHMNNRGLQPPEPLVRILSACENLAPGDRIEAEMDRQPMFLFPELEERGLAYACVPSTEGGYLVTVERAS